MIQELTFTTEIPISIVGNGIEKSGDGRVEIQWNLCLNYNSKGIYEIEIVVPEQEVVTEIESFDEEIDDYITETKTLSIKSVDVEYGGKLRYGALPYQIDKYGDKYEIRF